MQQRTPIRKIGVSTLVIAMTWFSNLSAHAQVKKWIDKDGKVHYGDAISAPTKSEEVKINDNRGSFKTEVNLPQAPTKNNNPQKIEQNTDKEKLGLSPSILKVCLQYGKQLSARPATNLSIDEANTQMKIANSLKSSCPGVKIHCTASATNPENNQCEAVRANNDGVVFDEQRDGAYRQVSVKK